MDERSSTSQERTPSSWRRRKKSVLGKDFQPPALSDTKAGHYCKRCKMRHGYKGYSQMIVRFEKFGATFRLLWFCPKHGDQIGETILGNTTETGEDSA